MTTVVYVKCGRPPIQNPSPLQRSQRVKLTTHWHLVQRISRRALRHQPTWSSASEDLPSSPPLHAYKLSHLHCFAFAVKWVALLHIREVQGSYPDIRAALRTGGFRGCTRFLHTNAEIVPKIRPRPIPSASFPISPFEPTVCNLGAFRSFLVSHYNNKVTASSHGDRCANGLLGS